MGLRTQYGSTHLDEIFVYMMRSYLRSRESGLLSIALPVAQGSEHLLIDNYLLKSVTLILDAQPPEIVDAILEAEYTATTQQNRLSACELLQLHLIRLLVPPVLQQRKIEVLASYANLWNDTAHSYAFQTFYPNLSAPEQERLHVRDLLPPQEMWRLNDF